MDTISTRNKTRSIVLLNILLVAMVFLLFDLSFENLIRVLTGNFFADSVMNLIFNIPFLVVFLVVRRKFRGLLLFLLGLNVLWFYSDVISIMFGPFLPLFPPHEWQYVRSCVGAGFLAFGLSVICLVRGNDAWAIRISSFGLFAPFVSLCMVLLALRHHDVSWLLFTD